MRKPSKFVWMNKDKVCMDIGASTGRFYGLYAPKMAQTIAGSSARVATKLFGVTILIHIHPCQNQADKIAQIIQSIKPQVRSRLLHPLSKFQLNSFK